MAVTSCENADGTIIAYYNNSLYPVHRNKCHLFQECISFTMAMDKVTYCPNRKSQRFMST